MSEPLVSVLMTSYNREAFIAEAIESVLAQTIGDFELIVSDDAVDRQDGGDRERRTHVAIRASACRSTSGNLGDYRNRNVSAATLARGRFLKYHDSDDVMYPHCLAVMVDAFLEREPTAAFALSGGRHWPGGPCPMLLTPTLAYEREFLGSGTVSSRPRRRAVPDRASFRESRRISTRVEPPRTTCSG